MPGGPTARVEGLVVESIEGELVVYDRESQLAHALSRDAARVWRMCDGERSVAQIAAGLGVDLELVERALGELERCELLRSGDAADRSGAPEPQLSRRGMLARTAAVAGAGMLITTISVPPAFASGSPSEYATVTVQTTGDGAGNSDLSYTVSPTTTYPAGSSGTIATEGETSEVDFSPNGANAPDITNLMYPIVTLEYLTGEDSGQVSLYIQSGTTSLHYDFVDTTSPQNNTMATINTNGAFFNYNPGDQFTLTFTFLSG